MIIKPEFGKKYRTRDGHIVTAAKHPHADDLVNLQCEDESFRLAAGFLHTVWLKNGRGNLDESYPSNRDLVAEILEDEPGRRIELPLLPGQRYLDRSGREVVLREGLYSGQLEAVRANGDSRAILLPNGRAQYATDNDLMTKLPDKEEPVKEEVKSDCIVPQAGKKYRTRDGEEVLCDRIDGILARLVYRDDRYCCHVLACNGRGNSDGGPDCPCDLVEELPEEKSDCVIPQDGKRYRTRGGEVITARVQGEMVGFEYSNGEVFRNQVYASTGRARSSGKDALLDLVEEVPSPVSLQDGHWYRSREGLKVRVQPVDDRGELFNAYSLTPTGEMRCEFNVWKEGNRSPGKTAYPEDLVEELPEEEQLRLEASVHAGSKAAEEPSEPETGWACGPEPETEPEPLEEVVSVRVGRLYRLRGGETALASKNDNGMVSMLALGGRSLRIWESGWNNDSVDGDDYTPTELDAVEELPEEVVPVRPGRRYRLRGGLIGQTGLRHPPCPSTAVVRVTLSDGVRHLIWSDGWDDDEHEPSEWDAVEELPLVSPALQKGCCYELCNGERAGPFVKDGTGLWESRYGSDIVKKQRWFDTGLSVHHDKEEYDLKQKLEIDPELLEDTGLTLEEGKRYVRADGRVTRPLRLQTTDCERVAPLPTYRDDGEDYIFGLNYGPNGIAPNVTPEQRSHNTLVREHVEEKVAEVPIESPVEAPQEKEEKPSWLPLQAGKLYKHRNGEVARAETYRPMKGREALRLRDGVDESCICFVDTGVNCYEVGEYDVVDEVEEPAVVWAEPGSEDSCVVELVKSELAELRKELVAERRAESELLAKWMESMSDKLSQQFEKLAVGDRSASPTESFEAIVSELVAKQREVLAQMDVDVTASESQQPSWLPVVEGKEYLTRDGHVARVDKESHYPGCWIMRDDTYRTFSCVKDTGLNYLLFPEYDLVGPAPVAEEKSEPEPEKSVAKFVCPQEGRCYQLENGEMVGPMRKVYGYEFEAVYNGQGRIWHVTGKGYLHGRTSEGAGMVRDLCVDPELLKDTGLTLEEGKKYVQADGQVVGPMRKIAYSGSVGPLPVLQGEGSPFGYVPNGITPSIYGSSPRRILVKEHVEESEKSRPGAAVAQIDAEEEKAFSDACDAVMAKSQEQPAWLPLEVGKSYKLANGSRAEMTDISSYVHYAGTAIHGQLNGEERSWLLETGQHLLLKDELHVVGPWEEEEEKSPAWLPLQLGKLYKHRSGRISRAEESISLRDCLMLSDVSDRRAVFCRIDNGLHYYNEKENDVVGEAEEPAEQKEKSPAWLPLQLGKLYKTRGGVVVRAEEGCYDRTYKLMSNGSTWFCNCYIDSGLDCHYDSEAFDVVGEAEEPPEQKEKSPAWLPLQLGKRYRTRGGRTAISAEPQPPIFEPGCMGGREEGCLIMVEDQGRRFNSYIADGKSPYSIEEFELVGPVEEEAKEEEEKSPDWLPLQLGKRYLTRDGRVVEVKSKAKFTPGCLIMRDSSSNNFTVRIADGKNVLRAEGCDLVGPAEEEEFGEQEERDYLQELDETLSALDEDQQVEEGKEQAVQGGNYNRVFVGYDHAEIDPVTWRGAYVVPDELATQILKEDYKEKRTVGEKQTGWATSAPAIDTNNTISKDTNMNAIDNTINKSARSIVGSRILRVATAGLSCLGLGLYAGRSQQAEETQQVQTELRSDLYDAGAGEYRLDPATGQTKWVKIQN